MPAPLNTRQSANRQTPTVPALNSRATMWMNPPPLDVPGCKAQHLTRTIHFSPPRFDVMLVVDNTWLNSAQSMNTAESNHDKILNVLGLGRTLNHLDRRSFQTYVPSKYRGSELEDRDAVHRMSEIVLLHDTGLRLTYLSCESYDGESVEYKLLGIEIVTTGGDTHRVLDVNFEQRIVITKNDRISFDNLSMKPV